MELCLELLENIDDNPNVLDYRGLHIEFLEDEDGQQWYTNWEGKKIYFGALNLNYKDDMKCIIDDKLDTISRFTTQKLSGWRLTWFDNGGHRDIKLTYRLRIVKIFIVKSEEAVKANIQQVVDQALQTIENYKGVIYD